MGCCEHSVNHDASTLLGPNESIEEKSTAIRTGSLFEDFSKIRFARYLSMKKGRLSDHYEILEIIGEGAYGTVRRAICKLSGEGRAVKSLLKTFVTKEQGKTMFTEVDLLRNLDHPNILRIYEVIEDMRFYHIVTALCTGGELLDRLVQSQRMTESLAVSYITQVLSAVMHCHSHNIIHRDLKPENLLFQDGAESAPLIVIDFGISRIKTSKKRLSFKRYGTPYYAAPEVLSGICRKKSDIWSCGVLLYLMLCGYLPFPGSTQSEISKRIRDTELLFPEEEWGSISEEAKGLIKTMLQKDLMCRPTAKQLLASHWIRSQRTTHSLDKELGVTTFERLANFRSTLRLTHGVLEFIASHYSAKSELDQLQSMFLTLDMNKDGMLSPHELIKGINFLELPHVNAEAIVKHCDVNGNGHIDYSEFLTACANYHQLFTKEKLAVAFSAFDNDGDGVIDLVELKNALGGEELADERVWLDIMKEVDQNGDGVIDLKEFEIALLSKSECFL